MVMAGSTLSTQAMKDTLPLRDAFAVLFFVSVGMLFNPAVLWNEPAALAATALIIMGLKSVTAYGALRAFRHPQRRALDISAQLAQIGEFSFILIVMGTDLNVVPADARDLVVAGALLSILINPVLLWAALRYAAVAGPVAVPEVADDMTAPSATSDRAPAT